MVKLRSICQAVNDIRKSDPGTAMTEGFLRLLIENGDVSYEICGSRICLNIDLLFQELAYLFELESEAMPKLRTVKGALKEIKTADAGSVIADCVSAQSAAFNQPTNLRLRPRLLFVGAWIEIRVGTPPQVP